MTLAKIWQQIQKELTQLQARSHLFQCLEAMKGNFIPTITDQRHLGDVDDESSNTQDTGMILFYFFERAVGDREYKSAGSSCFSFFLRHVSVSLVSVVKYAELEASQNASGATVIDAKSISSFSALEFKVCFTIIFSLLRSLFFVFFQHTHIT